MYYRIEACTDIEIYHPTGEGSQFELGDRPRAVYPLVILLTVPSDQIQWDYPDSMSGGVIKLILIYRNRSYIFLGVPYHALHIHFNSCRGHIKLALA